MIDKKDRFKDEELLHLAKKCGSNSAYNELLKRYKAYAGALASENASLFTNTGLSKDDVSQVGFIAFLKAYDKVSDDTTSFYLYWKSIARHEMYNLYEKYSYQKSSSIFGGISLDEEVFDGIALSDRVGEIDEELNKQSLINELILIIHKNKDVLNEKEILVLKSILQGQSYEEISKKLKIKENYARVLYNSGVKKLKKNLNK